ncbi:MAG: acetolactate synthase large subunit [Pseudonocardiales bacterium]|jgi:thiamine pyrophosphate-dependent acetolactate synthase large subunit-like protein|nr:acetolactate synthase large subunit [Pseudonocardiales bacterium]
MKTYQQLALLLADAGVTTVFGVMGDGNMHWIAAYREQPGCRWRPAWHEAGAVWMADGYAAATGDVGVATVTMGPGLAQSLAALATAVRVRRPLLLITAALPTRVPPDAQDSRQRDLVAATGARYVAARSAGEIPTALAIALESARAGDVTVLAVDLDVFLEPADGARAAVRGTGTRAARHSDPVALAAAADALRAATAPMVVIGRGVRNADCLDAALQLGRRVGAVFATTLGGRTALPDEPFDVGVIGMMADPTARALAGRADVVLVLGAALDRYNCDGGDFARNAHVIRVDSRPPDELWSPSERTTWLTGSVSDIVPALTARLPEAAARPPEAAGIRTPEVRAALAAERARQDALADLRPADGANPWAMVAELDGALPADAYVVVGIGHFWYFVAPYLRPAPRRTFHFACGFGLIGQALPVAVGAAAAVGEQHPVVAIEGDGSLPMNVQELQAAVRHGVDLLLVVMNNQAYGSEYHKLALADLDVAGSEFDTVPFDVVEVSRAMGATARRAADPDELGAALRELLPLPGVRVIDSQISRSTLSEVYERQHGRPANH